MKKLEKSLSIYPVIETIETAKFIIAEDSFAVKECPNYTILTFVDPRIVAIVDKYIKETCSELIVGHPSYLHENQYIVDKGFTVVVKPTQTDCGLVSITLTRAAVEEWHTNVVDETLPFENSITVMIKDGKLYTNYSNIKKK